MASSSASKAFSVIVLASDLGIDARPLLSLKYRRRRRLRRRTGTTALLFYRPPIIYMTSTSSNSSAWKAAAINRATLFSHRRKVLSGFVNSEAEHVTAGGRKWIHSDFASAHVIPGERLKKYVFHKILTEMPDGPFCIVYIHSTVQKDDNSPGITILRWIYEELPMIVKTDFSLYWKIKYISRLQYLWQDIKKEDLEIPEFVQEHDKILEHRPLTDYGIEPDPFHLTEVPSTSYSFGRYQSGW